jgi:hypothetical protein
LVGYDGGELKDLSDVYVHVPSDNMEQVEDMHLMLEHLICTTVREIVEEAEYKVPESIATENWAWRLSLAPAAFEHNGNGSNGSSDEDLTPSETALERLFLPGAD